MIRNILWDFDGTLFNTYPAFGKAFRKAINDLGKDLPDEWIIEKAKVSMDYCLESIVERCGLDATLIDEKFTEHYHEIQPNDQPPFAGADKVCRFIVEKGGKNVIVTHRRGAGMLRLLDAFDMRRFFSAWITSDDEYPDKPDPTSFLAVMKSESLNSAETLAIGDRDIDILAGQGAGLTTCLFNDKTVNADPSMHISNFDVLFSWLQSQHIESRNA